MATRIFPLTPLIIGNAALPIPVASVPVMHVFEAAGLGKAPYKFLGIQKRTYQAHYSAPVQPGASCMFCSTGIVYLFWLRSTDNKTFFVGSDCIMKSGDAGLKAIIDPHVKAHEREMRVERENQYISEFNKFVATTGYWTRPMLWGKVRDESKGVNASGLTLYAANGPHPNSYFTSKGKTLADYMKYVYDGSGQSARARDSHNILIAEGLMKKFDRCAKRVSKEVAAGIVPVGAIMVQKTLFRVIPDAGDEIFTVA
jgi:hypothetical protein